MSIKMIAATEHAILGILLFCQLMQFIIFIVPASHSTHVTKVAGSDEIYQTARKCHLSEDLRLPTVSGLIWAHACSPSCVWEMRGGVIATLTITFTL